MAVRKYDENLIAKAAGIDTTVGVGVPSGPTRWEVLEKKDRALQIAKELSENGSKAEDVIADARVYFDFLMEDSF